MGKEKVVLTGGKVDIDDHDPAYIVYKIGIYGWRKRCIYFLILLVLIMAIINLALTIWIIRVQDFSFSGMGRLHITKDGVKMDGTADFLSALKAKTIKSRKDSPIQIVSGTNLSLSTVDRNNKVNGQIAMDSRQIVMKNKELLIQNAKGNTLFYADDKKIKMNIDNMDITVPGGLNFQSSIQTSTVKNNDNDDLQIESLTRKLYAKAAQGINITSKGSDIKFQSLQDTKFVSKAGKIVLDAKTIQLKNIRESKVPTKSDLSAGNTGNIYDGIAEVCACKDGTLFLAPPDSGLPCKVTKDVCPSVS